MASAQTARARWACASDYDPQKAIGHPPGWGGAKTQRLKGQPIRGRASLAQHLASRAPASFSIHSKAVKQVEGEKKQKTKTGGGCAQTYRRERLRP